MANPVLELEIEVDSRRAELAITRLQRSLNALGRSAASLSRAFNSLRVGDVFSGIQSSASSASVALQRIGSSANNAGRSLVTVASRSNLARAAIARLGAFSVLENYLGA